MTGGKMCPVHLVAFILLFVGGVNWGLVGLFDFDLVDYLLGQWAIVADIVYVLVGVSALVMLTGGKCKKCK